MLIIILNFELKLLSCLLFLYNFDIIIIMIKYTFEQQMAIDQDGSLIVSASAGSGKTTVMIQRILRLLQAGVNVGGLFVSTFTKASAQDMQTKLKDKLSELALHDSMFSHLADSVSLASIGTFHSLGSKFVRQYFYAANVDPDFVLMDEQESSIILQESITRVLDKAHEEPTDAFLNLYNVTLQNRSDRALREQIARVYQYCMAQVDWAEWLDHAVDSHLDASACIKWYNDMMESKKAGLKDSLKRFLDYTKSIGLDFGIYIEELQMCLEGKAVPLTRLSKSKCKIDSENGDHLDKYEEFSKLKKYVQDTVEKLNEELADPHLAYDIASELVHLCKQTCIEYANSKKEIAKLDFGDIEHSMLKVLKDEDARRQLASSITHMFVDEYQDINPLQDKILGILGEKAEVFVVGDVKQSIYSFRMCDPRFFVQKMQPKTLLANNMQLINLNGNFRSSSKILSFVNNVFAPIMTTASGGAEYAKDSMLTGGNPTLNAEESDMPAVECKIIHNYKPESGDKLEPYDILNHPNQIDGNAAEIDVIARHVAKLVLEHNVPFEDIAILTHARDKFCYQLCDTLNALGFDTKLEQQKTVLDSKESVSLLAYLSLVDYVRNDIALATILSSGFYNMSDADLTAIRMADADGFSFYDSCKKYIKIHESEIANKLSTENDIGTKLSTESEIATKFSTDSNIATKLSALFEKIEYYQSLKNSLTVGQLAYTIVAQHDFLFSLYKDEGSSQVLYWFLEDIEKHPYQHDLFRYLKSVYENVPKLRQFSQSGCINIMTVHASKGLEFDYIILPNIDKLFNKDYSRQKFLFNSTLGIASKYFDIQNGLTHSNAVFEYFRNIIDSGARAEEMRLMYVALTRAKKQIFMTMDSSASEYKKDDGVNKWSDWLYPVVQQLGTYNNCYFDEGWQKLSVSNDGVVGEAKLDLNSKNDDSDFEMNTLAEQLSENTRPKVFGKPNEHLVELIKESIITPWQNTASVSKSSVTRLLKTEETEPVLYEDESAVELGTAYHNLLQDIDLTVDFDIAFSKLESITKEYVDNGIEIKTSILEKAHIMLCKFSKDCKIYREKQFMLNANNFKLPIVEGEWKDSGDAKSNSYINYNNDAKGSDESNYHSVVKGDDSGYILASEYYNTSLIQGVIDFVAIKDDTATIVDYKISVSKNNYKSYSRQLLLYAHAITKILGINKIKTYLYDITRAKLYNEGDLSSVHEK